MNALSILIIVSGPSIAILWLAAELRAQRACRIALGLLSMVLMTSAAVLATLIVTQLDYNQYYGFATKGLIEESVKGLESGHTSSVLKELRRLQEDYQPTYEYRAKFVPLVEASIERMKQEIGNRPRPNGTTNLNQSVPIETESTPFPAGSGR